MGMVQQQWWKKIKPNLWYRSLRDEAYMRHRLRQELEQDLREIVRGQRKQTETVKCGFAELGVQIRNLQDAIVWSTRVIADNLGSLERTMSWGFAQVIWQQEQTNPLLQDALKKLMGLRPTKAEELREKGNEYFRNGLNTRHTEDRERWMNFAIESYLKALNKSPTDFSIFHSLGVIQFFEKGNSEVALKCFREAAGLAQPYSPRHAAIAWLYLGYVYRNRNELEEAYQATLEAVDLQPDWGEAHYQHAVHCALTGRMDEMRQHLVEAIWLNEDYFPKPGVDPDLLPFHQEVMDVLEKEMERVQREVEKEKNILSRALKVFSNPVFPLLPEEHQLLQSVSDAFRQATSYVALRQALSQHQTKALPFIRKKIQNLSVTLSPDEGEIEVSFSPDGKFLVTKGVSVQVWEVGSWKEVAFLEHNDSVRAFSFSPDAKFLVTSSIFEAKVWGVGSWNEIATFNWHKFSFSPDGKFLAFVDRGSGTVKVLETENWKEIADLRGHGEIAQRAEEVVFSPDGKFLASTIGNERIKVWEVGSWMEVATINKLDNPIGNLIFSPDGKYLVWDGLKIMEVWEVGSWKKLPGLLYTQPVSVFSPDGKFLAVLWEGDMVILEINSVRRWKVAVTLEHKDVNVFVFSPDGKFLASGSDDKTVKVWEVGSWREIATFSLEDEVLSVAFSPDGKFLASGGELGEVKVWGWGFQDSLTGEVLQDLEVLERWLEKLPTP